MSPLRHDDVLDRLRGVAPLLGFGPEDTAELAIRGPGPLLAALAQSVRTDRRPRDIWLLLVALGGGLPSSTMVCDAGRDLALARPALADRAFLAATVTYPDRYLKCRLEFVSRCVVVDVDFSARSSHNTGIQRVVRQIARRWDAAHDIVLTAWQNEGAALRRLRPIERQRVTNWGQSSPVTDDGPPNPIRPALVVPIDSTIVVTEVPGGRACASLAAMAETGVNKISLIGYDTIPISSAYAVPSTESDKFVEYLSLVKHADRVAGISVTAAEEFAGFTSTLTAQGLPGPIVITVPLPVDVAAMGARPEVSANVRPSILCVGSQEPRKNQYGVLVAAETLWQRGFDFTLTFIGGGSAWFTRGFDRDVATLAKRGRPVNIRRKVDDDALALAYSRALFTVFPSFHEGYGLPVAESLAYGVPVITTSYGSTAEIAAGGGCLTVNPRNPGDLTNAIETLLTQPDRLEALRAEIKRRPKRTWDDYATHLWRVLVDGKVL